MTDITLLERIEKLIAEREVYQHVVCSTMITDLRALITECRRAAQLDAQIAALKKKDAPIS